MKKFISAIALSVLSTAAMANSATDDALATVMRCDQVGDLVQGSLLTQLVTSGHLTASYTDYADLLLKFQSMSRATDKVEADLGSKAYAYVTAAPDKVVGIGAHHSGIINTLVKAQCLLDITESFTSNDEHNQRTLEEANRAINRHDQQISEYDETWKHVHHDLELKDKETARIKALNTAQ